MRRSATSKGSRGCITRCATSRLRERTNEGKLRMRLLRYPGVWGVLWLLLVAGSGSLRAAPPPPATPPGGPSPPTRTVPRLALTPYYSWYQADPRKPAPLSHTRRSDGSSALAAHPWDGSGPWFSYDRV